jgi:hypothetical protein
LDVVVVDDGSTDGTADVVRETAAKANGRVTFIRQANAGLAAATQSALEHARGELVAICDADDEWLPGKVRMQVEIFVAAPKVSLVYGDMQVIDESGAVLDDSFFRRQGITPLRGRVLDELVSVNFTTNSTLMFRGGDLPHVPVESPYADYWLVMHAAAVGDLELVSRPLANYRLHSSNMSFGAAGDRLLRESLRELNIRRLLLTSDISAGVSAQALARAAVDLHENAHSLSRASAVALSELVAVSDVQRRRAYVEMERARVAHDARSRLHAWALASLLDPQSDGARAGLAHCLSSLAATGEATVPASPAVSRCVTVGWAAELISDPALIAGYCARLERDSGATLVIVADSADLQGTAQRLRACLISVGIDPDDCPDMALVPQSADLVGLGATAKLTAAPRA